MRVLKSPHTSLSFFYDSYWCIFTVTPCFFGFGAVCSCDGSLWQHDRFQWLDFGLVFWGSFHPAGLVSRRAFIMEFCEESLEEFITTVAIGFASFVTPPTLQGFRFTDLDQLALWGVDRKALSVRDPSAVGIDSMGRHGMRFQGTCSTCGSLSALGNWCLQFRSAQNLKWMWCIGNWLEAIEHFGSTNCIAIWTINHSSPILSTSTAVNFFCARLWSSTVVWIMYWFQFFWLLQTRHGGNLLCQIQDKSAVHISTNRNPTDGKCLSVSTAEVPVLLDFGNCIRLPEEQRCLDMFFFTDPMHDVDGNC